MRKYRIKTKRVELRVLVNMFTDSMKNPEWLKNVSYGSIVFGIKMVDKFGRLTDPIRHVDIHKEKFFSFTAYEFDYFIKAVGYKRNSYACDEYTNEVFRNIYNQWIKQQIELAEHYVHSLHN
jgi:hypothetical protein